MAIAVIGGIIVSTVLSLVVVPSFFLVMDDLSRLASRVIGRWSRGTGEEIPSLAPNVVAKLGARQERGSERLAKNLVHHGYPVNAARISRKK